MTANLTLAIVAGVMIACGVYLITERSLSRILIGVVLASKGPAGGAPIIGVTPKDQMADPLPQAMVLTAIVITLSVAAFVMTMAYRSFQTNGDDEVPDDVEDARIAELARADRTSESFEELRFSDTGEDVVSE
jgi:multicomponent Na+:H+ antiporter subunit C